MPGEDNLVTRAPAILSSNFVVSGRSGVASRDGAADDELAQASAVPFSFTPSTSSSFAPSQSRTGGAAAQSFGGTVARPPELAVMGAAHRGPTIANAPVPAPVSPTGPSGFFGFF